MLDVTEQSIALEQRVSPAQTAILVSGAGFAGLATALCLSRIGYRVTVIEAASALRKGGSPVDIEGEAIEALAHMGLLEAVMEKALPPRRLEFKDENDSTIGSLENRPDPDDASEVRYEIHRDDLLEILSAALEGVADVVFGRSLKQLEQRASGVLVTFDDGLQSDYALVFGCDGNRSSVRRLVFGSEQDFSHYMGGYFFIKVVLATDLVPANVSQVFSAPGRTAMLNGYDIKTDVALAFRSGREIDYDYRDRRQQRRMIHEHFDGLGWKVPEMLDHVDTDDDFYFDKVNQVRMLTWSKGRVALVGDAGYCVSPVAGMGGSLAIIGAARLADAMARHSANHATAFRDYEDRLRPFVEKIQEKAVGVGMAFMFPADDAEIKERNRKLSSGDIKL